MTEPTNEALIDDLDAKRYQYENDEIDDFTQITKAKRALRTRLAALTAAAEYHKRDAALEKEEAHNQRMLVCAASDARKAAEAELADERARRHATVANIWRLAGHENNSTDEREALSVLEAELASTRGALEAFVAARRMVDGKESGWVISGPAPSLSHALPLARATLAALAKPEPADGSPEPQAVNWICPVHKTCSTPGECQKNDSCMAAPQEMK